MGKPAVWIFQYAGLHLRRAGKQQMSNNSTKMAKEDWAPGFYIKHFIKDMRIAVEEADQRGAELPILRRSWASTGACGSSRPSSGRTGKRRMKSAALRNISNAALF